MKTHTTDKPGKMRIKNFLPDGQINFKINTHHFCHRVLASLRLMLNPELEDSYGMNFPFRTVHHSGKRMGNKRWKVFYGFSPFRV